MKKNSIPRWRGFNLLERFTIKRQPVSPFKEDDFKWISEWGFDFVRIPTDYRFWIRDNDPFSIDEQELEELDRAVRLGERYNLHVSLNLHRAPGYCINDVDKEEPFSLWKDADALDAFCLHWETLAKRYLGISPEKLSFDLVNEPPKISEEVMTRADHERVVRKTFDTIRAVDPERRIVIDGLEGGNTAAPELADLKVAQSCRAYLPMTVSHYKASWIKAITDWPEPVWPGIKQFDTWWDLPRLKEHYTQWTGLLDKGVGVHCGEGGFFKFTPHKVGLAWLRDVLEILTPYDIGYSLWNFRGPFGILNSGREDIEYENWQGQKLDRGLLELLQEF